MTPSYALSASDLPSENEHRVSGESSPPPDFNRVRDEAAGLEHSKLDAIYDSKEMLKPHPSIRCSRSRETDAATTMRSLHGLNSKARSQRRRAT